jgi:hypothetical protein
MLRATLGQGVAQLLHRSRIAIRPFHKQGLEVDQVFRHSSGLPTMAQTRGCQPLAEDPRASLIHGVHNNFISFSERWLELLVYWHAIFLQACPRTGLHGT